MTIIERCPKCELPNTFDLGDPNDYTLPDAEMMECYSCSHQWVEDGTEDILIDLYGEDYKTEAYILKGNSIEEEL